MAGEFSRKIAWGVVLGAAAISAAGQTPADPDPNRFAAEIKAFAAWDSKNAVPAHPVLFVGSSSIRLWRTHEAFPDLPVVNRGFGGSQISDVIHFADRLVLPYRASVIVFFAGSNDIAAGKSAQRVCDDYHRFVALVHARRPATRVIFLAINPCRSRWSLWPEMQKANALIQEFCRSDPRLVFADSTPVFLGPDGLLNDHLFLKDHLHPSAQGYALWAKFVLPLLQKTLAAAAPTR